jgi:hypothetical protein
MTRMASKIEQVESRLITHKNWFRSSANVKEPEFLPTDSHDVGEICGDANCPGASERGCKITDPSLASEVEDCDRR